MKKLLVALAVLLGSAGAASAQNATPAYWQGTLTAGHGACFQNTGAGVTIQDASTGICTFPLGLNLGQGGQITVSGGASNQANSKVWTSIGNVQGTYNDVGHSAVFYYNINQYNVTRAAAGGLRGTMINTNLGGTQQVGGFVNFDSELNINVATADVQGTSNPVYQAANFGANASVNVGGTAPTIGGANGVNFVADFYATLGPNATNWRGNNGVEIDLNAQTGSSVLFSTGLAVVLLTSNTVQPSVEADAFLIGSQGGGATPTITCGLCFTGYNGFNALAASASILKLFPHGGVGAYPQASITDGIDLHLFAFSGFAFRGANDTFDVDGSGNVTGASYKVGATAGVSCTAGTVSTTTMVVTSGIVTHC